MPVMEKASAESGRGRRRVRLPSLAVFTVALGACLAAAQSEAASAHYLCRWVKNVGKPFTLTVHDGTTYIQGSLGIFGQVAQTIEDEARYGVRLDLAGGFVVFRWPKKGGSSAVGFFDSRGELQGGHKAAATCTLE